MKLYSPEPLIINHHDRMQHISCQEVYKFFSPEELRWQDLCIEMEEKRDSVRQFKTCQLEEMQSPLRRLRVRLPVVTDRSINLETVKELQDELDRKNLELRDLRDLNESMDVEKKELAEKLARLANVETDLLLANERLDKAMQKALESDSSQKGELNEAWAISGKTLRLRTTRSKIKTVSMTNKRTCHFLVNE